MTPEEYYRLVYPSLRESFERSDLVIGYGRELIQRMGYGPWDLQVTVQPSTRLWRLAAEWGLEVFLPIRGRGNGAVLFPFDFEVSLPDSNLLLYTSADSQSRYFSRYILPVSHRIERFLGERKIPYLLDFTPSGGHFLFYAVRGTEGWTAAASIGFVEEDLKAAYRWTDPTGADLKRRTPIDEEEGAVFSGFSRLAEFIALKVVGESKTILPDDGWTVQFCDAADDAVNLDLSWGGDPLYYRVMRAPGSLHKKNMNRPQTAAHGPLADVKAAWFDSKAVRRGAGETPEILGAMWSLERAAEMNRLTPGHIPFANEGLAALVGEYAASGLGRLHRAFDAEPAPPRGETRRRALSDKRLDEATRAAAYAPNPRMLQPKVLKGVARDCLARGWSPREVASLIRDCYIDPYFGWSVDWMKLPAETRANFWARIYASVALLEAGEPLV